MNSYQFDDLTKTLTLYTRDGLHHFCNDNKIELEKFNYSVRIAPSLTDCSLLFVDCHSLNKPVILHDGVSACNYMFDRCYAFNQEVDVPASVKHAKHMFLDCWSLSSKVTMHREYDSDLFAGCPHMNDNGMPFTGPHYVFVEATNTLILLHKEGVKVFCKDKGVGRSKFNHKIIVTTSVTSCSRMLMGCTSFNQPFILPAGIKYCDGMLNGCKAFDQHITIPSSVIDASCAFKDCKSLNHFPTIKGEPRQHRFMFSGCSSLRGKVPTEYLNLWDDNSEEIDF